MDEDSLEVPQNRRRRRGLYFTEADRGNNKTRPVRPPSRTSNCKHGFLDLCQSEESNCIHVEMRKIRQLV